MVLNFNNYIRIFLPGLFLVFGPVILEAQNTGSWKNDASEQQQVKAALTGKIIDMTSQSPLEYATITLFNQQDSLMETGGSLIWKGILKLKQKRGSILRKLNSFLTKQNIFLISFLMVKIQ